MAVTLTDALSRLNRPGDAVLIRGLVPSSGMANALAQFNNNPQTDRGYAIQGGKGSPQGGLETRVSTKKAVKENLGGITSSVKNYIKDPFAFKRRLEEEKAISKEGMKYAISRTEANLLWGNAKGLFNTATNAQTSLLFGIFEVLRLQTRYAIAQARVLGVKSTELKKPFDDPKKNPLAHIFSGISSDIQRIPGMGFLTGLTKNVLNVASILNPFTMGSKAMNLKPGEWFQKLLMGKESYELAKDPNKAVEKAGLKLSDQQRTTNLMRATANYLREQLNVQSNILRGVQDIVRLMGSELKIQKLDIGHDEYSGELKNSIGLEQDRLKREAALTSVYQQAARKSIVGKITPIASFFSGFGSGEGGTKLQIQGKSKKNKDKLYNYDRQLMTDIVQSDKFFTFLKFLEKREPNNPLIVSLQSILEKTKGKLNFFLEDESIKSDLIVFKNALYDEYNYPSSQWTKSKEYQGFRQAFELSENTAGERQGSQQAAYRNMQKAASVFDSLGGGRTIHDTGALARQHHFLDRFSGNSAIAKVSAGSAMESVLLNAEENNINQFFRSIPIFGVGRGFEDAYRRAEIGNRVLEAMSPSKELEDPMSSFYNESPSSNSSSARQEPRKTTLTVGGMGQLPNFGNPLADAIGVAIQYVFYNIPVMRFTKLPYPRLSIAGAIGAIASGTGDINGLSLSTQEREERLQEKEEKKAEVAFRDEQNQILERIAENSEKTAEAELERIRREERYQIKGKGEEKKSGGLLSSLLGGLGGFVGNNWGKLGLTAAFFSSDFGKNLVNGIFDTTTLAGKIVGGAFDAAGFVWNNLLVPAVNGVKLFLFGGKDESGKEVEGQAPSLLMKMWNSHNENLMENPISTLLLDAVIFGKLWTGPVGKILKGSYGLFKKLKLKGSFLALTAGGVVSSVMGLFGGEKKSETPPVPGKKTGFFTKILEMSKGFLKKHLSKRAFQWGVAGALTGSGFFPGVGTIGGFVLSVIAGELVDGLFTLFTGSSLTEHIYGYAKKIWNFVFGESAKELDDAVKKSQDKVTEMLQKDTAEKEKEGLTITAPKDRSGTLGKFFTDALRKPSNIADDEKIPVTKEEKEKYDSLTGDEREEYAHELTAKYSQKKQKLYEKNSINSAAEIAATQKKLDKAQQEGEPNNKDSGGIPEENQTVSGIGSAPTKVMTAAQQEASARSDTDASDRQGFLENAAKLNSAVKKTETSEETNQSSETSGGVSGYIEKMLLDTIHSTFGAGSALMGLLGDTLGGGSGGSPGHGVPSGIDMDDITSTSEFFESRGKPTTIGYDSGGGTSYGRHQLASKSSMKDFLEWVKSQGENGKKIYDTMYQSVGGDWSKLNTGSKTGAPVDAWLQLVNDGTLGDLDKKFFTDLWFPRTLKTLPGSLRQLVTDNKPLQHAIFSGMIHHGEAGVKRLAVDAYKPGMTSEEWTNAFYGLRAERKQGDASTRAGLMKRYNEERNIILAMINPQKYGDRLNYEVASGKFIKPQGMWSAYPNISPENLSEWKIGEDNKLVWPTTSHMITSPAGPRNPGNGGSKAHKGIDIAGNIGAPVMAALPGEVAQVAPNPWGIVTLKHPNGWQSRYLHLSQSNVKVHDKVEAGQKIGEVGDKRDRHKIPSMGPHLHFEMIKDSKYADPEGVFHAYDKAGGNTGYADHKYKGIGQNRWIESKLAGHYGTDKKVESKQSAGSGPPIGSGPEDEEVTAKVFDPVYKLNITDRRGYTERYNSVDEVKEAIERGKAELKSMKETMGDAYDQDLAFRPGSPYNEFGSIRGYGPALVTQYIEDLEKGLENNRWEYWGKKERIVKGEEARKVIAEQEKKEEEKKRMEAEILDEEKQTKKKLFDLFQNPEKHLLKIPSGMKPSLVEKIKNYNEDVKRYNRIYPDEYSWDKQSTGEQSETTRQINRDIFDKRIELEKEIANTLQEKSDTERQKTETTIQPRKTSETIKEQFDELKRTESEVQKEEEKKKEEENPMLIEMRKANQIATSTIEQQANSMSSASGAPSPAMGSVSTPQGAVESSGGGGSLALGDPVIDGFIDRLFAQIGNLISNLNIAHTNLSITTT